MGLLRTAATVAVASSVHGRVQRRQQARWAGQGQQAAAQHAQQPPPPQPPPPQDQVPAGPAHPNDTAERLANLAKLGELMNAGLLTQAEFEQQKARILGT